MPIYEFYCKKCNTLFNFFSRSPNTDKKPLCPRCKKVKLERRMSLFAKVSGEKSEAPGGDGMPPVSPERMEKAMAMLAGEAEKMSDEDPRQAAAMVRKLTEATGLNLSAGMEEALQRLEKGEDPDKIEEEMGAIFEHEDPFVPEKKGPRAKRRVTPLVDDTLYEL